MRGRLDPVAALAVGLLAVPVAAVLAVLLELVVPLVLPVDVPDELPLELPLAEWLEWEGLEPDRGSVYWLLPASCATAAAGRSATAAEASTAAREARITRVCVADAPDRDC